jgi:hypothetical protein
VSLIDVNWLEQEARRSCEVMMNGIGVHKIYRFFATWWNAFVNWCQNYEPIDGQKKMFVT